MNTRLLGGFQLLSASIIFGLYGVLYRNISEFGSFTQSWVKSLIIVIFFVTYFYFDRHKWKNYKFKDLPWFLLWMVPNSVEHAFIFLAFNNLPVGLVYFLFYGGIMISSFIIGALFFKEHLNKVKILSLVLTIAGITIIYGTSLSFVNLTYIILAIGSGALAGMWNVLSKKLSNKYHSEQMLLTDNFTVILVSVFFAYYFKESFPTNVSPASWFWILVFAISSISANALVIKGFRKVEAQIGSLIMPTQIIFGAIAGVLFFRETLGIDTYIGGALIFIAALLPYFKDLQYVKKIASR